MDTNCKAVITDPSVYIVFRYKFGFYRMAVILLTLISIFYMYMYMTAIYFKEDFKVNTAVPLLESGGFVNFIIFVGAITGWLTPIYAATDCMRKCTQDVVSNAGCARIMFNIFCQFRNHKVPIPLGKKKKNSNCSPRAHHWFTSICILTQYYGTYIFHVCDEKHGRVINRKWKRDRNYNRK